MAIHLNQRQSGGRLRRALPFALAALLLALAAALALSAIGLCREGAARRAEDPLAAIYTPEAVAARLKSLAPLALLTAIVAAAGLALGLRGRPKQPGTGPVEKQGTGDRGRLSIALVAAALALIVLGVLNGSARDVLYKAANICTECIGLG